MNTWFWYAVAAAILYGAHQIFTRLASEHIGDGLGGFIVEMVGLNYSALTGICVGAGTILFFLLFQQGGPLSAVPAILAGGAAIMAIAGIAFFQEPASWQRMLGITLSIAGLFLLRR